MSTAWKGAVWIGPGAAYFIGAAGDNDLHAHYAIQIVVGMAGDLCISDGETTLQGPGVVVASNKVHRFHPDQTGKILVWVEPDSALGRLIAQHFELKERGWAAIDAGKASAVIQVVNRLEGGAAPGQQRVASIIAILSDTAVTTKPIDKRVDLAIHYIRTHFNELDPDQLDSLEKVAERLSITPRYLRRLFEREIGMSMQRYRLWCKLCHALSLAVSGQSLTDAAIASNFTDSAHFSRTFRDMFGTSPSHIISDGPHGVTHPSSSLSGDTSFAFDHSGFNMTIIIPR
jgi:AraC-like DNA-binding protein